MKISANEYLKSADENVAILVYSSGILEETKKYWAYAAILPSKYQALKEAERNGNYELDDYGDVLFWGYGDSPPPDAKAEIEQLLNASSNFEQELTESFGKFMKNYQPGFVDKIIARKFFK